MATHLNDIEYKKKKQKKTKKKKTKKNNNNNNNKKNNNNILLLCAGLQIQFDFVFVLYSFITIHIIKRS